jgi:predicted RNA-binding Zn-ribbon protein involved in translation (DUF1610 family)
MKTQCSFCNRSLKVENNLDGKDFNCPSCGEEFIVVPVIETPKLDNASNNMIECLSCGKKVYKFKQTCPHCGNKIKKGNKQKTRLEGFCELPRIWSMKKMQKTKFDDLCVILSLGSFVFGFTAIPAIICGILVLSKKDLSIQKKIKVYIGLSISVLFLGLFVFLFGYANWYARQYEKRQKDKIAKRKASIAKAKEDEAKAVKAKFEAEKKAFIDNIEKHYAEFMKYHRLGNYAEVFRIAHEFNKYGQKHYRLVLLYYRKDREKQLLQLLKNNEIDEYFAYEELLKVWPENKTYQMKFSELKKEQEAKERYNQMLRSLGSKGIKDIAICKMFYKIQEGESPSSYMKYIIKSSGRADKRIKVANILDDYVIYNYSYFGRELFQFQFAMPRNKNKIYLEDQSLKPGNYLVANHALFQNAFGKKITLLILKPVSIDIK